MKFEIKNRFTGAVQFSCELSAEFDGKEYSIQLGAAVKSALSSSADLSYANLRYANLSSADLRYANLRHADLSSANLSSADLSYANLRSANLRYADLSSADLSSANLSYANLKLDDGTRLPTGETWKEYREQVVPALLTAGGKELAAVVAESWECHSWENCPMAVAFGVHNLDKIPVLYRPRAEQFIQFFDAKMLPKPEAKLA